MQSCGPFLAVDAGGTSTRAVLVDSGGRAYGYGRAGSGNPTASGVAGAVQSVGAAVEEALPLGERPPVAVIAMAGEKTPGFREQVSARLAALGVGRVVLEHDLLGVFHSGTPHPDGYALIAGTGTVATRVRGGRVERVVGGRGWLLGDAGGGFWIGHAAARAVVATLDGQAPETALTPLVLEAVGVQADLDAESGRVEALRQLVSALYARPPVALARFAPLAFAAHEDPVARGILVAASQALADLVTAVLVPDLGGPLVVGGSVVVRGLLAAPPELRSALVPLAPGMEVVAVPDGVVGAAVLALRYAGLRVDDALFSTLLTSVAQVSHEGPTRPASTKRPPDPRWSQEVT